MKLSSLQGSVLEDRVMRDDFKVDSISTARLLALCQGNQIPVITIDATNAAALVPLLPFDNNIKEDILNAVNQGLVVKAPDRVVTYQDWSGVGYLKENPTTGESGWMLSGMIAGGMTVWVPSKWPPTLWDVFKNVSNLKPNFDSTSGKYIVKISGTDLQRGTVGKELEKPLTVAVLYA